MSDLALEVTETPEPGDVDVIGKALAAFNDVDVGPAARRIIAVFLRDEAGAIVAGLSGYTAWGWLYVQWLFVSEAQRGKGLAGHMLRAAEAEAKARGCHSAHIDTFNPHALGTYERAGYVVFGQLPDFPLGRTRSFLAKRL
ncbi:GNAT family N-acetyltransferase [Devosia sediminis]|uniref:GNAT family N-acetyltransferase n=1 Tax=Devosia sediminis TaxID=2798801 RepID=A0A934IX94_9HYPH|nr:GNAT family N-acetyltransferase [Devosia sediminis]MBJ3786052.1 GNAT family N-acetyltransferase [Devosia sediminis]